MDRCSRKKSFADSRPSESIGGLAGSSKFEEGKEYRKRFPTRNKDKLQSKPAVVLAPILPAMFTETPLLGYFCEGYAYALGFATPVPLSFCVNSLHFVASEWNWGRNTRRLLKTATRFHWSESVHLHPL
ncbi:hypothetical protein CDAR_591471 [Caerostris darwini]|uniref:Uncharacterized protein n=1 Tax=Caerostris darwini TaxID=1538125 RepID=A0AAV4PI75_9ARAC|nr:hypothetical protein CDAR_591471 [Caerostris darwini]